MRATARLAPQGQTQWIGGDARRRRKTERGSFSASLLSRETPRSVLGGFAARVAPDLAESPLFGRSRETRLGYHLKRRPAPQSAEGYFRHKGGTLIATRSAGRGWESQFRPFEERESKPQRPRAEGIPSPKATRRAH